MANPHPQTNQLAPTQWQPGQSGNPAGKPKGTKHLSTHIREMMEDENFVHTFANGTTYKGAPAQAVVRTLIDRAINGELKAFDLLAKYGYGTKIELEAQELSVPILAGLVIEKYRDED